MLVLLELKYLLQVLGQELFCSGFGKLGELDLALFEDEDGDLPLVVFIVKLGLCFDFVELVLFEHHGDDLLVEIKVSFEDSD